MLAQHFAAMNFGGAPALSIAPAMDHLPQ